MGRFAKTSAGRGKGDMGGKRITRREQNATATDKKLRNLIERLLQVEVLVIENEQEVFTAMVALKQGHESFADALIAELGARVRCTRTLTFDRKATRLPGFELI
jgi:predicted nucleic-acid-binding protein